MKTLEEFNADRYAYYKMVKEGRVPAGVKCDKCDNEMILPEPNSVLASYPAKRKVLCPHCGHTGYMVS